MSRKTALITGATGQDGSYLSELLLSKDYTVWSIIRRSSTNTTERIAHLIGKDGFELIEGDITDSACITNLVSGIKPDELYNLAAMSHVGTSFSQPVFTCHANALGPLYILEAIRQTSPRTRLYQASTSENFGDTTISPQDENTPFNPNSPYAVAKVYAHHMIGLYRRAYGLFACAGVLFNHESKRRGENFVTRKITKYVAKLRDMADRGETPVAGKNVAPLGLGNIDARRDWSHAKDMVYGMWLMLQREKPDDYVLGSGQTRSVRDFLVAAFAYCDLNYEDFVVIDPEFYRPSDVNLLCANPAKATAQLGWKPQISFDALVHEMVLCDLELIRKCRD